MPEGLNDHLVEFPEGFYDMQKWPERLPVGHQMRVTKEQYVLMKGSDPSVQLVSVGPDPETVRRIVEAARKERAEEVDWKPVGWYKAQLSKDPAVKEYLANE